MASYSSIAQMSGRQLESDLQREMPEQLATSLLCLIHICIGWTSDIASQAHFSLCHCIIFTLRDGIVGAALFHA